ncbi:uncharacterized protein LOC135389725 [Ornithodoros turicata]|uniref:uncharacterized protein LOC135389725 n=1 Tax=Ornithodoros turicata TaxID=34597 RepID=UPI003139CE9A
MTTHLSLVPRSNRVLREKKLATLLQAATSLCAVDRAVASVSAISQAIEQSSFQITKRSPSSCAPWWNDACTRDYRRRKAAWKQLLSNTCYANWKKYQIVKASLKRTISAAKQAFHNGHNSFLSHPRHRKALHRHIAFIRSQRSCSPSDLAVLSDADAHQRLEDVAIGLAARFHNTVPLPPTPPSPGSSHPDFVAVTSAELDCIVRALPATAPGPDGVSAGVIKSLWSSHPRALLDIINTSLETSWIPSAWKAARVVLLKKVASKGLALDNIRPIALTSVLCKTVERVIHRRLSDFVDSAGVYNCSQIGFRSRCSVWMAHLNLESQLRRAQEMGEFSALVTLDIAQAYDSVEHCVLLQKLASVGTPMYIFSWVRNFLFGRSFQCSDRHLVSSSQALHRGVPQGAVLSPLLFNILMSSLPLDPGILTITYADDVAFFASAHSLHTLYTKLQGHVDRILAWTREVHLSLKIPKCAVLLIPPPGYRGATPHIELMIGNQSIDQSPTLKYLGVWYDDRLTWGYHVDYISKRASVALGCLQRCASVRVGMRRNALLYVYKCYVRPILEYGCVIFSHLPDYRLRKLFILERKAIRLCLGLPRFTANDALYLESHVLPLKDRFRLLTVNTLLSLLQNPLALEHNDSLKYMRSWMCRRWRKSNIPQLLFAQLLLTPLDVSLVDIAPPMPPPVPISVQVLDIFRPGAKHTSLNHLQTVLNCHFSRFSDHLIIATDASVSDERAGVGIVIPQLDARFPIRLPDFTPVYESEFLAMVLALLKVPPLFCKALLISDSLSVVSALDCRDSSLFPVLASLAPSHISHLIVTWVPGHCGLPLNEAADTLAKMALSGPVLPILPPVAAVVRARYKRYLSLARPPPRLGYEHLSFAWNPRYCHSRRAEVCLTRLRCLALPLNFYLHRSGVQPSPGCPACGHDETLQHFVLDCSTYRRLRLQSLTLPLLRFSVPLSLCALLSFGASHTGKWNPVIADNLISFVAGSNRF